MRTQADQSLDHPHRHRGHVHEGHGRMHGVIDPSIATAAKGIWAIKRSFLGLTLTAVSWCPSATKGLSEMIRAGEHIAGRILLQHARNDTIAPVQISRTLFTALHRNGKKVESKEYEPLLNVEGHALFSASLFSVWGGDVMHELDQVLLGCGH